LRRLHRLEQPDPRVPASSGAEHGAAAGKRTQGRFIKSLFHARTRPSQQPALIRESRTKIAPDLVILTKPRPMADRLALDHLAPRWCRQH
jgi:hypothetical protein